jgi:Zn-dependent protease with chaperone function
VLRTLRTLKPVEVAVGRAVKLSTGFLHSEMLGNAVRVGPRQFPRIHRAATSCARTLGIPTPRVYLVPNIATINAATYGLDGDAFIMVHAATVQHLTDAELRFVIGHECGHIQNNHVVYLTTLHLLNTMLGALGAQLLAPLVMPARVALQAWARAAEITCDRAGLLCVRDLDVATDAFVKLAVGSKELFAELDREVYFTQLEESREGYGRMGEMHRSHPDLTRRIQCLRAFADSALYRGALGQEGGFDRAELERRTEAIVKVL